MDLAAVAGTAAESGASAATVGVLTTSASKLGAAGVAAPAAVGAASAGLPTVAVSLDFSTATGATGASWGATAIENVCTLVSGLLLEWPAAFDPTESAAWPTACSMASTWENDCFSSCCAMQKKQKNKTKQRNPVRTSPASSLGDDAAFVPNEALIRANTVCSRLVSLSPEPTLATASPAWSMAFSSSATYAPKTKTRVKPRQHKSKGETVPAWRDQHPHWPPAQTLQWLR